MNLKLHEKIKTLLHLSALPDNVKSFILDNLEKFNEKNCKKLIKALENEQKRLKKISFTLQKLEKEQNKEWKELAKKQKKFAQKAADDYLRKIAK